MNEEMIKKVLRDLMKSGKTTYNLISLSRQRRRWKSEPTLHNLFMLQTQLSRSAAQKYYRSLLATSSNFRLH